jgi:hypothetical protein
MKPLTDIQQTRIVNNVMAACRDINKLNKTGYEFLYLASGFIAHYDINGFKAHYSEPGSLQRDIEDNARSNQWHNFRKGERDADYYHSKRDTYNAILGRFAAAQYFREHVTVIYVGDPA